MPLLFRVIQFIKLINELVHQGLLFELKVIGFFVTLLLTFLLIYLFRLS